MEVKITIDGRTVTTEKGRGLLGVARRNGFRIPYLCYIDGLPPLESCRLCIVELEKPEGKSKIITSCNYPVRGGEVVFTSTEKLNRLRKVVLELLLSLAPNSDLLRTLAQRYGADQSRFPERTMRKGCILCRKCLVACNALAEIGALCIANRGGATLLTTSYGEEPSECIACGVCKAVCPTGAATMIEVTTIRRLLKVPASERWCRYHFMGFFPGTICPRGYNCSYCDVDSSCHMLYGKHPLLSKLPFDALAVLPQVQENDCEMERPAANRR